jgi:hypothetical protein
MVTTTLEILAMMKLDVLVLLVVCVIDYQALNSSRTFALELAFSSM